MGTPRTFDHDAARACVKSGETYAVVARRFGVSTSTIGWLFRKHFDRRRQPDRVNNRGNRRLLASLGVDGTDPVRAAREATVSARIRALRAEARAGGALLCGPLQVAAAHAAGLTLDDIEEVFAVPPAEAVRAIAAHAGR
jgi:transposase-like protein